MTREKLDERLKNLIQERDNVKSAMAAYEGAIQDCQYWIAELDKQSEEDKVEE